MKRESSSSSSTSDITHQISGLSSEKRALLELRLKQRARRKSGKQIVHRKTKGNAKPLSFAQQRLWLLDQLEPNNPVYNVYRTWRLSGVLNIDALQKALSSVVARHEVLRSTFKLEDGQPIQLTAAALNVPLPTINLQELSAVEREMKSVHLAVKEARLPFNLAEGPLFRAKLLKLANEEHIFLLTLHHIVTDGWSLGVLHRELSALYEAFVEDQPSPLSELSIQYSDYSFWQREWLQDDRLEKQLSYWKQQLAGLPTLQLPTDRTRPTVERFRGGRESLVLSQELTFSLKNLSQREGVTLFMTLLAAFKILLYRYAGQADIVIGSPIANRNQAEIEGLIGFFVNTLVLRTNLTGNPTFLELLQRVRKMALGAHAHQDIPFATLVEELQPQRDMSRNPLFQVAFTLQNTPDQTLALSGINVSPFNVGNVSPYNTGNDTSKFDLNVFMLETDGGIEGILDYNTDLFDVATIQRMVAHFQTLLEGIVAHPEHRLLDLPIMADKECQQLLVEWNNISQQVLKDKCIHHMIEAQIEHAPNTIAVIFEEKEITYGELNRRANQLAHHLINQGIGRGSRVGLFLERSLDIVVALLGVLKTGGAYVCLDPDHPPARLAYILSDADTDFVLSKMSLLDRLPESCPHILCLDRDRHLFENENQYNPRVAMQPEDLSYIVYTSGSTGEPKGIMAHHRGVVNYLDYIVDTYRIGPKDTILQLPSLTFDAAVRDLIGSLAAGAKAVIIGSDDSRNADVILEKVCHYRVSCLLSVVPSMLDALVRANHLTSKVSGMVRLILISGEPLQYSACKMALQLFGKQTQLVNQYGPTECTMTSTYQPVDTADDQEGLVLAGKPIRNYQIYVLGPNLTIAPINVRGEIYIGGVGLAWGYVGRPDLTAGSFLPDPFSKHPGARMYKTGDLGCWHPDGRIEIKGRIDHQVKINGSRVELGEIESALREHAEIGEAVTMAREDMPGNRQLVAYVIAVGDIILSDEALRAHLAARLPNYMIPHRFMWLDKFPLTSTGKVDRKALPAPVQDHSEEIVTPFTLVERIVADIWSQVLSVEKVGMNDDFFKLGGHSLQAAQLCHRLSEAFNIEFPLQQLFQVATVAGVTTFIEEGRESKEETNKPTLQTRTSMVALQPYGQKKPIFLIPGGFGDERIIFFLYGKLVPHLGADQPVYAFRVRVVEGETKSQSDVTQVAASYIRELRNKQPKGPYQLAGFCNGGLVAYEMAQQLLAEGDKVAVLVLADTRVPRQTRYFYHVVHLLRTSVRRNYTMLLNLPKRVAHHLNAASTMNQRSRLFYLLDKARKTKRFYELGTKPYMSLHPDPTVAKRMQRGRLSYRRTLYKYRPKPYPGRIHLLVSEGMMDVAGPKIWAKLADGGIELKQTKGNHRTHIKDYSEYAAKELKACFATKNEELGEGT